MIIGVRIRKRKKLKKCVERYALEEIIDPSTKVLYDYIKPLKVILGSSGVYLIIYNMLILMGSSTIGLLESVKIAIFGSHQNVFPLIGGGLVFVYLAFKIPGDKEKVELYKKASMKLIKFLRKKCRKKNKNIT